MKVKHLSNFDKQNFGKLIICSWVHKRKGLAGENCDNLLEISQIHKCIKYKSNQSF